MNYCTDLVEYDKDGSEPRLSRMGLKVPQGVVGGLVVTGVSLGGWAVLQQHQCHWKDDVPKVKVLVQDLQIRSYKGHTSKVIQRA